MPEANERKLRKQSLLILAQCLSFFACAEFACGQPSCCRSVFILAAIVVVVDVANNLFVPRQGSNQRHQWQSFCGIKQLACQLAASASSIVSLSCGFQDQIDFFYAGAKKLGLKILCKRETTMPILFFPGLFYYKLPHKKTFREKLATNDEEKLG